MGGRESESTHLMLLLCKCNLYSYLIAVHYNIVHILFQSHVIVTCFIYNSISRCPVTSVTKSNKQSFVANSMTPVKLVARAFALTLLTIILVYRGGQSLKCFHQLSSCACIVTADNSSVLDFSPLDAGGFIRIAFQAEDGHVPPRRWLYFNLIF